MCGVLSALHVVLHMYLLHMYSSLVFLHMFQSTYIKFKSCYGKDPYVCTVYNRGHRVILTKFRSGILRLSIKTGCFQNIPREFRL